MLSRWLKRIQGAMIIGFCLMIGLGSGAALAQKQEIVIKPVGNKVLFDLDEITAKAGSKLVIIMDNIATNPAMAHNWVLLDVKPADTTTVQRIGLASMKAGEAKEFIPDDDAILAYTPLAAPGQKTQVELTVPPPGDYAYICSFLGHYMQMKGVLHSVE